MTWTHRVLKIPEFLRIGESITITELVNRTCELDVFNKSNRKDHIILHDVIHSLPKGSTSKKIEIMRLVCFLRFVIEIRLNGFVDPRAIMYFPVKD